MRIDETTSTSTDKDTGATHTEIVRERAYGLQRGGSGLSTAIVAVVAILAIALGAWFVVTRSDAGASADAGSDGTTQDTTQDSTTDGTTDGTTDSGADGESGGGVDLDIGGEG